MVPFTPKRTLAFRRIRLRLFSRTFISCPISSRLFQPFFEVPRPRTEFPFAYRHREIELFEFLLLLASQDVCQFPEWTQAFAFRQSPLYQTANQGKLDVKTQR